MNGPSPHLSWAELACKDGTPYPAEWQDRAAVLAAEFEAIRAAVGKPIRIGSAYRTKTWNHKVGGAKKSQHMEGRALDLYPPPGMTVDELHRICRHRAVLEESAINGLGLYPTFVHIDIRPWTGRVESWAGSRAWAELKATR